MGELGLVLKLVGTTICVKVDSGAVATGAVIVMGSKGPGYEDVLVISDVEDGSTTVELGEELAVVLWSGIPGEVEDPLPLPVVVG